MKRSIALFLTLILLLSASGCGILPPVKQPTQTTTSETAEPPQSTPEDTPPIPTSFSPDTPPVTTPIPETTPPEAVTQPEPKDEDFVRVRDYIPDIIVDLRYATGNNFTDQRIYDFEELWLRYGTVKKLAQVQEELRQQGLLLKVWDGFRPISAQYKLWEICPDPTYVSDPKKGSNSHSRGIAVDVTLVNADGTELVMPTGFDDFTKLADRDYSDCPPEAAANALLLERLMEKYDFKPYRGEWWHFSDNQSYPVEEVFEPCAQAWYYADCEEYISLRTGADFSAEVLMQIPVNGQFVVLGSAGDFALVRYQGLYGYVIKSHIKPLSNIATPAVPVNWVANCKQYITLWASPEGKDAIVKIPAGEGVWLKQWQGKYARVVYGEKEGYVLSSYIMPENADYFSRQLSVVKPMQVYSYEQMCSDVNALKEQYPDAVSVETIGKSELGNPIPVLRIGNINAEHHVFLQGAIHGREHMTAWLLMAMADYWLGNDIAQYGDICYHIVPMSNPDGVTVSQTGVLNESQKEIYQRDRDLGFTDLTQEKYAKIWKANALGVDINRNFPSGWELVKGKDSPSYQTYKGEAPFSSAEAEALRAYVEKYPFAATISYHTTGSIIYYEYGHKQPVNAFSKELALAVHSVTGYPLVGSEELDGAGLKDWAMDALQIPSLTVEVGCLSTPLEEREIYCIFARNCYVLPAIARWIYR